MRGDKGVQRGRHALDDLDRITLRSPKVGGAGVVVLQAEVAGPAEVQHGACSARGELQAQGDFWRGIDCHASAALHPRRSIAVEEHEQGVGNGAFRVIRLMRKADTAQNFGMESGSARDASGALDRGRVTGG